MAILVLLFVQIAAGETRFREQRIMLDTALRGAAPIDHGEWIAWGEGVFRLREGSHAKWVAAGSYQEGGCLFDGGLAVQESGQAERFVWLDPKRWRPSVIDTGMDTRDCVSADLFGRHGVLVIHRQMQVRFYERGGKTGVRWPYQEVYSFYTASRQGGLIRQDIDGDGRPDVLAGNYWIRAPEAFDRAWRLFAINTYFETSDAAFLRIAPAGRDIVVSQREMRPARLTWFERPANTTDLWIEHRIGETLGLEAISALAIADLDQDGRLDVVAGENRGAASRLIVFWNRGQFRWEPQVIAAGRPFLQAWIDGGRLVTLSPSGLSWWARLQ